MVNTSTRYIVYNHNGGGVRHHHFSTLNDIINEVPGTASPGNILPVEAFPYQFYNGVQVPFAFMSVHGAADGNFLYTTPGSQQVAVGNEDVAVLVVYAPAGGIGVGGGPGVWVDAFNVDTGDFSDSDFIEVLTPPTPPDAVDAGKSQYANAEGEVPTLNAENLRAFQIVDGAPFLEWKKITPMEVLEGSRDIQLASSESNEIWFAFYQTLSMRASLGHLKDVVAYALGRWVDDDYCGTRPPRHIGPNGPDFQINIEAELAEKLSTADREKLYEYLRTYPSVAQAAYTGMSKMTDILQGVSELLERPQGLAAGKR